MDRQKLIHQLFIGKVADVLGMEKTTELLKEAKEAFAITSVSTRTFAENQEVTYKGKKYFFKEYNPRIGKTLIANAKSVGYDDYNDWWVDSTYVC